ncbi:Response regulator [Sulfidibacter corallicola]|uniref:Response regulator n=1 Tax=Sulfidibacter corallicola TaxID=2818388 RepID=A0A8A4TFU5_SULCO|nr:response regulator [Sulfidibacter corallicola]QTD48062.1 response regulator [Sulfidibacter corallicola]
MEGKFRLLIVDDDPAILKTMKAIARHHRHLETEVVDQPAKASEKIQNNAPYHIILTDLVMPGITGVDLLRMAKAKSPDTKVILVASFGDQQILMDAIKYGVYDYIHKPFRPEELNLMLNNCTERFLHLREKHDLKQELVLNKTKLEEYDAEVLALRHEIARLRTLLKQYEPDMEDMPQDISQAIAKAAAKRVTNIQQYDIYRELRDLTNLYEEKRITQQEFQEFRKALLERAYRTSLTSA